MDRDYILFIKNLILGFYNKKGKLSYAVHGLNLKVPRGKTFVLLGESGCGKSVSANAVMQLLPDDTYIDGQSSIIFEGEDLLAKPEANMQKIRGQKIAMIFQDPMSALNPVIPVGKQITEMLLERKVMSKQQCEKHAIALLKEVGIDNPDVRYKHYPHEFSGGQKQRIVIAMALAGRPKLIIADEPTTALDVTTQAQILFLLKKLQQKYGLSILMITHDLGVAKLIGDVTGVMYAGHLVEINNSNEIMNNPLHPYTQELMAAIPSFEKADKLLNVSKGQVSDINSTLSECRYIKRCPLKMNICHKLLPYWQNIENDHVRCHLFNEEFMSVKRIRNKDKNISKISKEQHTNQTVLAVKNLSVNYQRSRGFLKKKTSVIKAVDNISLNLKKGKTIAIVGESGSGKTSAGKAIVDLIPKEGRVYLNGIYLAKIHQKFRRRIQIVFQDTYSSLNPKLTIRDVITEGLLLHEKNPTIIENKLRNVLGEVGLSYDMLDRYPHQFSGGQRQRIAIARSLILSPDLIVLDEPTSSLDVSIQAQILNLLKEIQVTKQLSYVLISHDLNVVGYMADEIAVMYQGKLVEYGTSKEILTSPKHPYTEQLLQSVPLNLSFDKMENYLKQNDYRLDLKSFTKGYLVDNKISFSKTHHVYCFDNYDRMSIT